MVKYSCEQCGKEFSQKSQYDSHNKCKINSNSIVNKTNEDIEQQNQIKINKLKFIDLFAGTGAFTLALETNDKFECVFTNDMMECSKKIYELNNPTHKFTLEDLNTINVLDIPSHDILCGGFPCQPFSIAGEKKGFDDNR